MEKLIDIIIPVYKAQSFIDKVLCSIGMQTIVDKVMVTLVNDADGCDYSRFIDLFSNLFTIQEIKLKENGGPGVARQAGIDATSAPYIVFLDADDTLMNAYALEIMLFAKNDEENKNASIIMFPFYEMTKDNKGTALERGENLVWLFAKLYDRSFLNKHNIRFNNSRANEDVYFNRLIDMCCEDISEKPIFYKFPMYTWHYNEKSITRENNCAYALNESFIGYAENAIQSIEEAAKRKYIKKQIINMNIIKLMIVLYNHYMTALVRNPEIAEKLFNIDIDFYDRLYSYVELLFPKDMLEKFILENNNTMVFPRFIPPLTFYQFIDKMKEELEKREANNE